MYEQWLIARWDTPVVDIDQLLMVSLVDSRGELTLTFEAFRSPERPRWTVRFGKSLGYRNIDEAYRLGLWRWLDQSGQRCGHTFLVQESPKLASWATEYLHEVIPSVRHFVIATEDDVIEVLCANEPSWEVAPPAKHDDPLPGKTLHLYAGEDDEEIERQLSDLRKKNTPH